MPSPAYTLRVSTRAKHVWLAVTPQAGLSVTIPCGFDRAELPGVLRRKDAWIRRALAAAEAQRVRLEAERTAPPPEHVALRAVEEQWLIRYRASPASRTGVYEQPRQELLVRGDLSDAEACKAALRRWVARKAHEHLPPWLDAAGRRHDLAYGRMVVKNQRTRWGSCSPHDTISLNQKLLFLPPRLVEYVLVHELCHTVHLDHSKRFWALVRAKEPRAAALDAELQDAGQYVPGWLHAPLRA